LLQVSGIGPAALLKQIGVVPVHDLPGVGENLQDHYQSRLVHECRTAMSLNDDIRSWWRKGRVGLEFLLNRTGPLTVCAGEVGVFAKTRPEIATPDVQFHFIAFSADKPQEGILHDFSGVTFSVC